MIRIDGKTLKELREELGYKKRDMCLELDVSLTTLTNWEVGVGTPRDWRDEYIVEYLLAEGYIGKGIVTK